MADVTIAGLTNELVTPGPNDWIGIWNLATGRYEKTKRSNLVGATITGGGTIALGGFTLTVAASGTAAILQAGAPFTITQTINPAATNQIGFNVNMPAATTVAALTLSYNSSLAFNFLAQAGARALQINGFDNGAGVGPNIQIGRNSQLGTPAAGHALMYSLGGTYYSLWPDNGGNWRSVANAEPTNATDTSGTVIGTQSSTAAAKYISDERSPIEAVADRIRAGAEAVRRFTYRSGSFGGEVFEGVVVDEAPAYGMDRDGEHPQGKSLNEINIMGDLLRMVDWAMQRIEALEARLGAG